LSFINYYLTVELFTSNITIAKFPKSIDYRKDGCVGPVDSQSQCGQSSPFAVVDVVQSVICKEDGVLERFSRQNVIDCAECETSVPSCLLYKGIVEKGGINTVSCYPENSPCEPQTCNYDPYCNYGPIQGCYDLQSADENLLAYVLSEYGPVTAIIDASHTSFQLYKSGIYYEPNCSSSRLDHAVSIVGYGSEGDNEFFIVKNSWGSAWGEKGYIRMSRNRKNNCGIASAVSFPYYTL